eukprot:scaffold25489_cov26-Phaeocystis_antarctica.AAC.1
MVRARRMCLAALGPTVHHHRRSRSQYSLAALAADAANDAAAAASRRHLPSRCHWLSTGYGSLSSPLCR